MSNAKPNIKIPERSAKPDVLLNAIGTLSIYSGVFPSFNNKTIPSIDSLTIGGITMANKFDKTINNRPKASDSLYFTKYFLSENKEFKIWVNPS